MTYPQNPRERQSYVCCLVLTCYLVLVAGCSIGSSDPVPMLVVTPTVELPFGTIVLSERSGIGSRHGESWRLAECPGLIIVADYDEIQAMGRRVEPALLKGLRVIDMDDCLIIGAFYGYAPVSHDGFGIERIVRRGDAVDVYANGGSDSASMVTAGVGASPYHVVCVEKPGEWNRPIRFTLYIDEKQVMMLDHWIPACAGPSPTPLPTVTPTATPMPPNTPGPPQPTVAYPEPAAAATPYPDPARPAPTPS